jgi:hypothetical protein
VERSSRTGAHVLRSENGVNLPENETGHPSKTG